MDSEFNQFSYDSKRLKEIGSLTGFNRDQNSSIYFGLRDQELNQLEVRSIPNSRGIDMGSSTQDKRSVNDDKYGPSKQSVLH